MMQLESHKFCQMAEELKQVAMVLKVSGYYSEAMTVLRAARELESV